MALLSGMFCGDNHSFDYTPTAVSEIKTINLYNGTYDELFASKNTSMSYDESSKVWDFDTVLYAKLQNSLFGGNVLFTSDTVNEVRIKRRKKGTYDWDTIFQIDIKTNDDFKFERFDRYARGNTEYEYTLVPVLSTIEGNLNTSSIISDFEGYYLLDKETIHHIFLNTSLSYQRNQNSTTLSTLGRKYPFHVSNGNNNYTSGELQATFIDMGEDNDLNTVDGWKYREEIDNFLTNGKPKILKDDQGKMWMIAIVDNIPQDFSEHWNMPIHTITWTEIGNCDDTADMYDNNFIDIDSRLIR